MIEGLDITTHVGETSAKISVSLRKIYLSQIQLF